MLTPVTELGRRLIVLACVGLAALVVAIGVGAAGGAAASSCDHPCTTDIPVAVSGAHSSVPCLRDAACSGGFVLGAGGGFAVALVVPAAFAIAALLVPHFRRRNGFRLLVGRLVAGGLFRPPRALLAS